MTINTNGEKIRIFLNSTELTQDGTPTPDTPQDIHVITGSNNIKISDGTEEQNYPIDLGILEYCKTGDYADQFFKNTIDSEFYDSTLELNEWYLKKNISIVAFNGSENWRERTNSGGVKQFYASSGSSNLLHYKQFCNYFSNYNQSLFNWGGVGDFAILTNTKVFYGGVSNNITLEDFKNKLANENLIVYYVLATPQYIHISETDYPTLKAQLDNLYNNAKSYDGTTNITQTNDDLPFNITYELISDDTEGKIRDVVYDINEFLRVNL